MCAKLEFLLGRGLSLIINYQLSIINLKTCTLRYLYKKIVENDAEEKYFKDNDLFGAYNRNDFSIRMRRPADSELDA